MANVSCRIAVRVTLVSLAFVACLLPAACTRQPPPELARDELFSLSLGPLDEQLDLFRIGGSAVRAATRISMRDGLFYIANGNAQKVLQLSSYGDLLLIIYDPRRNPAPVGLAAAAATRLAVPHELHEPSYLAVDSAQRIFVVDTVPDGAGGAQGQLVQRFASGGRHLGAIGREGVGGTPFPHIQRLAVTADDLLVVIARTPRQWLGYWYDAAGRLQEQVELPFIGALGDEEALVVWEVIPQLTERQLLLFVDAAPMESGAPNPTSVRDAPGVRVYDLATSSVVGAFALPAGGSRRGAAAGGGEEQAAPAYYPLGVTTDGLLFLTRRENEQMHSLVVLGRGGRVVTRRLLGVDEAGLRYLSLGMSARGVLYALLAEDERARVVWWRSDLLVAEVAGNRR